MSKPTKLTQRQWEHIRDRIKREQGATTIMLRSRMREQLGFTDRTYRYYDYDTMQFRQVVMLDWYDERKRTMFLLKYSDILNARVLHALPETLTW